MPKTAWLLLPLAAYGVPPAVSGAPSADAADAIVIAAVLAAAGYMQHWS